MQIDETILIVNQTFSIAMLLYFTLAFYWCCILLFIFMKTSANAWKKFHLFLISKAVVNAFMFGLLVAVIWSAAKAKNEGRRTAVILYTVRNEVEDEKVVKKVSWKFLRNN